MLHASSTDSLTLMSSSASPGVMQFNGRSYAVGLLWLTVQEELSKGLLRERIKKTKADYYCLRQHIAQQQGFGWLEKGHRRGMQAAAAMVADQLVGEWHGVFEADNGWWYVQVRSDTITPNGDRFFVSEEDAFHVFQEEAQKNIWPHSYAPERWHLTEVNTRELSLRNLLDELTTTPLMPTNLTSMFGSAGVRNIVLAGVALCVLAMMGIAMHTVTKPAPAPPARIKRAEQRAIQAPKDESKEIVSPQQLLQQCGAAADRLYVPIPGWTTAEFVCEIGKAGMIWRQDSGRLSTARDVGMAAWPNDVSVTFNNRQMQANLALGSLPKIERQQAVTQDMALIYLEQNLQPLGNLQIKPVTPRANARTSARAQRGTAAAGSARAGRAARAGANAIPPPPPAPYLDIQFMSGFGPDQIVPLLGAPGLELIKVTWRIPQAVWNYDLKWVYETPQAARAAQAGQNTGQGVTQGASTASSGREARRAARHATTQAQQASAQDDGPFGSVGDHAPQEGMPRDDMPQQQDELGAAPALVQEADSSAMLKPVDPVTEGASSGVIGAVPDSGAADDMMMPPQEDSMPLALDDSMPPPVDHDVTAE